MRGIRENVIVSLIWRRAIVLITVFGTVVMNRCAFIVLALTTVCPALGYCPSLCSCKSNKGSDGVLLEPQPGELLRLKCGGSPAQITELKEIDLSKLWTIVVSL